MEQDLVYRGVRYVVRSEIDGSREWVIYPDDGPTDGAAHGTARGEEGVLARGSFKEAALAAQAAIDAWCDEAGNITEVLR